MLGYGEPSLSWSVDEQLPNRGEAHVVVAADAVWVLGEVITGSETLTRLTRFGIAKKAPTTTEIAGEPALAVSSGSSGIWMASGSATPGSGMLRSLEVDHFGAPISLPSPIALVDVPSGVWWAAADGRVGLSDGQVASVAVPLNAGTGAADIAVSDSLVWVAEDSLVVIRPSE